MMASSLDAVFYARASLLCLLAAPDVFRGNQVKRSGLIVVGGAISCDDQVSDALSRCQVQMSPNRAAKAVH